MVRNGFLHLILSLSATIILAGCGNGSNNYSESKLIKTWNETVFDGIALFPESDPQNVKIITTSDNSVIGFASGDGLTAVYIGTEGQFNLVSSAVGEFDKLYYTDDNFIILEQRSGRSDDIYVKKYYHIANNEVNYIVTHESYYVNNDESLVSSVFSYGQKDEYTVSVSETEAISLMPKGESREITNILFFQE